MLLTLWLYGRIICLCVCVTEAAANIELGTRINVWFCVCVRVPPQSNYRCLMRGLCMCVLNTRLLLYVYECGGPQHRCIESNTTYTKTLTIDRMHTIPNGCKHIISLCQLIIMIVNALQTRSVKSETAGSNYV